MAQTQGARSMSRRPLSCFVPHIAGAVIGVTLVAAVLPLPKLLLWNASASATIGLYRINPFARPAVGDMVAVAPPPALARFIAERPYLPVGASLLTKVAATPERRRAESGGRECAFGLVAGEADIIKKK